MPRAGGGAGERNVGSEWARNDSCEDVNGCPPEKKEGTRKEDIAMAAPIINPPQRRTDKNRFRNHIFRMLSAINLEAYPLPKNESGISYGKFH